MTITSTPVEGGRGNHHHNHNHHNHNNHHQARKSAKSTSSTANQHQKSSSAHSTNKPVNLLTRKISPNGSSAQHGEPSQHQHVNHAYDMTLVKKSGASDHHDHYNNHHYHRDTSSGGNREITTIPVSYQATAAVAPPPPSQPHLSTKIASFSIQSLHNMFRNSIRGRTPTAAAATSGSNAKQQQQQQQHHPHPHPHAPVKSIAVNVQSGLKRESSQLLPQSIEKSIARNFQSITPFSGATSVGADTSVLANSSLEMSIGEHTNTQTHTQPTNLLISANVNTATFSYTTSNNNNNTNSNNNNNPTSKYTDSTSLPTSHMSSAEQSLKDEDAWLPILTIAEEQVRKTIHFVLNF